MSLLDATTTVKMVLAEERAKTRSQERRTRVYAQVLALYAHRLAIAQDRNPAQMMRQARDEVRELLDDKEWL